MNGMGVIGMKINSFWQRYESLFNLENYGLEIVWVVVPKDKYSEVDTHLPQ